jgi:N-acetylmuramoyl-L-alanine amidase
MSGVKMFCKTKILLFLELLLIAVVICLLPDSSSAQRKHLIVIDPAHGGEDSGVKITDKIGEKDITLAIALALQKELSKEGNFEVFLTRNSDEIVTLEERRKSIAKIKPDAFLSLHINGGFGKHASGYELYYPGFKDLTDTKKKAKGGSTDTGNRYLNDSFRLAQIIQKNLDTLFPRKGRGLREAQTPILEEINTPALVVEIGFGTNPEERKKLLSVKGQLEIAENLAKSVKLFFR